MCMNVSKDGAHKAGRQRWRESVDAAEPDRQEGEVSTCATEAEDDD